MILFVSNAKPYLAVLRNTARLSAILASKGLGRNILLYPNVSMEKGADRKMLAVHS